MYTVMRFVAPDGAGEGEIYRIGAELNSCIDNAFKRPDRVGGRFSVTIASGGQWTEHESRMLAFLEVIRPAASSAAAAGFTLEFDALVETEDLAGLPYINVTPSFELMRRLVSERVSLNITVPSPTDDGAYRPNEGP